MTPERRRLIDALYRAALERTASQRPTFLIEHTADDPSLRLAVESLLERQEATAMPHGAAARAGELGAASLVGELVSHYRIEEQLGAGGVGVVYRATDTKLERPVAIKFLAADVVDAAAQRRFQREAQMASSLNHPHILTVHDVGAHENRQYIVTEFVDGGTLADWAAADPGAVRRWPQVVELLLGVADALAAAHDARILHRDVKPGNILISKSGYAKLADFGLAKSADAGTRSSPSTLDAATAAGFVVGTLAYMAPEQALGRPVDARSDIFSFGVVLYELLSGRRPFTGDTDLKLVHAIIDSSPPPLSEDLPESLRLVVAKALAKEPVERYRSMRELVSDLRLVMRTASDIEQRGRTDSTNSGKGHAHVAARSARGRKRIESLAVLPLVNANGDPESEYLSEGIAESLINSFSQLPRLRVAQQQKSFRYRGVDVDLQQAASELRVQAVLTGKILLRADTLVVTMGLIDVERDAQVWGQRYTKRMADIFSLQDEIANEVLQTLKLKLSGNRKQKQTQNTDAYHLYLKGRFYWGKRTPEHVRKAIELYQQALDKDPGYALAYAGIADCYALLGFTPYGAMRPSEAFPRAKTAAQKALAFDPALAEAHASLGGCALMYEWDWKTSERAFHQSLAIAPDNVSARVWYSTLLAVTGRVEEGIEEAKRAMEADPLSVIAAAHLSLRLYNARRYEDAVVAGRKAIELDPAYPSAHAYLAFAYEARGDLSLAIESAKTVASIMRRPHWTACLGYFYAMAGRREDAIHILDELTVTSASVYVSPFSIALVYAGLGDSTGWRKWARASLEERSGLLMYMKCFSWFDSMRSDPFYEELLTNVGLP